MTAANVTMHTGGVVGAKDRSRVRRKVRRDMERLNVDVSSDTLRVLDNLVELTGSASRSEFIRNLIRHAAMMSDELMDGNTPAWEDKHGNRYRYPIHKVLFLRD